jgi:hypothetical protein
MSARPLTEQELLIIDYWQKPIPTNAHDWEASVQGQEEWGMGTGPTKEDAIKELLSILENKCICGNNGGGDCDFCQTRQDIELNLGIKP